MNIFFLSLLFCFFSSLLTYGQKTPTTPVDDSLKRAIKLIYDGKKAKELIKDMEMVGEISGYGLDYANVYATIYSNCDIDLRRKASNLKGEVVITKYRLQACEHFATGKVYRRKQNVEPQKKEE